ncbi:MAG: TadE/TadG family type IV pilus assembly protein [Caulobacteraceae bacterium]
MTRMARLIGRFLNDRRGANAVEFAIVATPFLMLFFGVIELGLLFLASTTIEAATINAARLIRTGQLQDSGNNTANVFQGDICSNMSWIASANCSSNLLVDVRTFASFSSISVSPPITNNALDASKVMFNDGSPCSIVLVRVYYPYTLLAPLLEPGMPNLGPSQRLITTTVAFRNEAYSGQVACT